MAKKLPHLVKDLPLIVVHRKDQRGTSYNFTVYKYCVYIALRYKIQHDKFYSNVIVDENALDNIPPNLDHNVFNELRTLHMEFDSDRNEVVFVGPLMETDERNIIECTTSMASKPPNAQREMELICAWVNNPNVDPTTMMDWPMIGASPINEYTTPGFLNMTFPSLFPNGKCDWLEPRLRKLHLHEFAKHLLRYRDNRFCKHPRFRYYMMNMIMRHRAHSSTVVCVKRSLHEMPITIQELCEHMDNTPHSHLADRLMRFGTSLRGTRSYWIKCRAKLTDMLHQIGRLTIFFTLSATDLYWPNLHVLMPETPPNNPREAQLWRKKNVIDYPHIVSQYMHSQYSTFRKEVLDKGMNVKDYWCRYEWQHRGSPHVHGFIWLNGAPNMDNIDWNNPDQLYYVESYLHDLVHACNPRQDTRLRNIQTYRYNAPWHLNLEASRIYKDLESGEMKFDPFRNDDRVNSYNRYILQLWRENIDWQPIMSKHVVTQYIAKYAANAEKSSKTYHQMLLQLANIENPDDLVAKAYRRLLTKTLIERDIGVQETSHMLLELPLVQSGRTFVNLNVSREVFKRVDLNTDDDNEEHTISFIDAYRNMPQILEVVCLIDAAKSWIYNRKRRGENKWSPRKVAAIVRVFPRFQSISAHHSEKWIDFFSSELLLYKPFREIHTDIGHNDESIVAKWDNFRYNQWHLERRGDIENSENEADSESEDNNAQSTTTENEWEILSRLHHGQIMQVSEIDMLGRRDIDRQTDWCQ
ncbi:uncharacterized protein LOC131857122 [Cryptomeria japonica]|uniref:uncharacterized protein LOC131857122 n=1 Tax=Cryptomeria japonica TaxID=3369 RepID=UPI0027DA6E56|nr:uncharacterized protein LOC131857122 [Cryptomeria japonica]